MIIELDTLKKTERLTLLLRKLYERYSYKKFSMNRMEEYAFYAQNLNFLESERIITFSDQDGRLMALKPDITLSVAKNASVCAGSLTRLYYIENVFRVSKEAGGFTELSQMGLECIGDITPYAVVEVLFLALKSLEAIDSTYALEISHQGLITGLLQTIDADWAIKERMRKYIGEKNRHDLMREAQKAGVPKEDADRLVRFASLPGDYKSALLELRDIACGNGDMMHAIDELDSVYAALSYPGLRLETSLVSDTNYYNGILFSGYVQSVPMAVVTGGRYDNLLARMGKKEAGGIGFAIYFDAIERYQREAQAESNPTYVLYDENTPISKILEVAESITKMGGSVNVCAALPECMEKSNTIDLRNGGGINA